MRHRFAPTDLDTGEHRVLGTVYVEGRCRAEDALDELPWVESLAETWPRPGRSYAG